MGWDTINFWKPPNALDFTQYAPTVFALRMALLLQGCGWEIYMDKQDRQDLGTVRQVMRVIVRS